MSRFLTPQRRVETNAATRRQILETAHARQQEDAEEQPARVTLPPEFQYRLCTEDDCDGMAALYKDVFESYPFPIHEPQYLAETMDSHVVYFGIWRQPEPTPVALASAEMEPAKGRVEMTDFATAPDYRGQGFGVFLLQRMEQEMAARQLTTAYTIARAISPGMNIVFAKQGYNYGGTLVNNTDICGRLESMNIWWKHLDN